MVSCPCYFDSLYQNLESLFNTLWGGVGHLILLSDVEL